MNSTSLFITINTQIVLCDSAPATSLSDDSIDEIVTKLKLETRAFLNSSELRFSIYVKKNFEFKFQSHDESLDHTVKKFELRRVPVKIKFSSKLYKCVVVPCCFACFVAYQGVNQPYFASNRNQVCSIIDIE